MPSTKRKPIKGHWPAGKRRNPDSGRWSRLRLSLTTILNSHYLPLVRSRSQLARDINVSVRSVGRWLAGEDVPTAESQDALQAWLSEQRQAVRRRP